MQPKAHLRRKSTSRPSACTATGNTDPHRKSRALQHPPGQPTNCNTHPCKLNIAATWTTRKLHHPALLHILRTTTAVCTAHCHPHITAYQPYTHSHHAVLSPDHSSQGVDVVLRPEADTLLYAPGVVLVPHSAVCDTAIDRIGAALRCGRCRARLGTADTTPYAADAAWLLEESALAGRDLRPDLNSDASCANSVGHPGSGVVHQGPPSPALPAAVRTLIALLLERAQAQAHGRFALLARGADHGANPPHVLLWLPSLAPVMVVGSGVSVAATAGGLSAPGPDPAPRLRVLYAAACLGLLSSADVGTLSKGTARLDFLMSGIDCMRCWHVL